MKFDVLHNFISPATGRVLSDFNYVLIGNKSGIAVPSPILIDVKLDLLNLRKDFDSLIFGDITININSLPLLSAAIFPDPTGLFPNIPIPNPTFNPRAPIDWIMSGPILGQIFIGGSNLIATNWETTISSSMAFAQHRIAQLLKQTSLGTFIMQTKTISYNWENPLMALLPLPLQNLYGLNSSFTFPNAQALDELIDISHPSGGLLKITDNTGVISIARPGPDYPSSSATYVLRLPDVNLPNAQVLNILGVGLLKLTADGHIADAIPGPDYPSSDVSYIISKTADLPFLPHAQALERLNNGIMVNNGGIINTLPANLSFVVMTSDDRLVSQSSGTQALVNILSPRTRLIPGIGAVTLLGAIHGDELVSGGIYAAAPLGSLIPFPLTQFIPVNFYNGDYVTATQGAAITQALWGVNTVAPPLPFPPIIDILAPELAVVINNTIGLGLIRSTAIMGTAIVANNAINFITQSYTPTLSHPNVQALSALDESGILRVSNRGKQGIVQLAKAEVDLKGQPNQIAITGTGIMTIGFAINPILPGTGGVTIPEGTTLQRGGGAGTIRFNTTTNLFEGYNGTSWVSFNTGIIPFHWNVVTSNTNLVAGNGYIPNITSLITFALPVSANIGDTFQIQGYNTGGWQIAQNASQRIIYGNLNTTVGASGYLSSTNPSDAVTFICTNTNVDFSVSASIGNLQIN